MVSNWHLRWVKLPRPDVHNRSSAAEFGSLWKQWNLVESFEKTTHQGVEIPVLATQIVDLADGMNHRRMVLAAETASDFRQRRVRQRFTEIHRDLPRHRD